MNGDYLSRIFFPLSKSFVIPLSFRGKSIGGNGSTDYLVKGTHTKVPQGLIKELKVICEVPIFTL